MSHQKIRIRYIWPLFGTFLLVGACASSSKKYVSHCSLRDPAVLTTIQSNIHRLRVNRGLGPLARDPMLQRAAQKQANRLALVGSLEHGQGGGPLLRLRKMGISRRLVGENIARVEHDRQPALTTFRYWTGRRTERENLVNPEFHRMGLGVTASERHCYSVLILSE